MGDGEQRRQHLSAGRYVKVVTADSALQESVTLIAANFGFPAVVVNIVDADTRHTIAAVGAPLGTAPRVSTLCDHTVRNGVPVVHSEVTTPPASSPHLQAYVGVPLTGGKGSWWARGVCSIPGPVTSVPSGWCSSSRSLRWW